MKNKKKPARLRTRRRSTSLLTRPLGLEGWTKLEPVVLAALASEEPLLLVGKHGTAKSFLLERLARALALEFRFYNASLISFDDLVGIPVPDDGGQSLRYISVPTAVWGAEVVFVDELNRTRPELQNKLFPLIHERRVQGIDLPGLRHCWAAMNPAPDLGAGEEDAYFGAEPLDPALADRFPFIVEVPDWGGLTKPEQRRVLLDSVRGAHEFASDPRALVERAAQTYQALRETPSRRIADYFVALTGREACCLGGLSTRRVAMLFRTTLAVHAARLTLAAARETRSEEPPEYEASAWLALLHGQPSLALKGKIDRVALLAAHRHAWRATEPGEGDARMVLLGISDPTERFVRAVELGSAVSDEDLSQLVLQAVASRKSGALRRTVALAAYLAVSDARDVAATTIETLAREVRCVLSPGNRDLTVPHPKRRVLAQVGRIVRSLQVDGKGPEVRRDRYLRNLLESLLPQGYGGTTPDEVAGLFRQLWGALALDRGQEVAA